MKALRFFYEEEIRHWQFQNKSWEMHEEVFSSCEI
jgi:hypothetical protein